jgi:hypothetical protein
MVNPRRTNEAVPGTAWGAEQMARDVFISYAKGDKAVADRICAALEGNGISCWIAPRDAKPGQPYQVQLIRAIQACKLMVLVYSSEVDASPFVPRELERAVAKNIPVLPFKITTDQPSEQIEFFLAMSQWFDATKGPLDDHMPRLVETVGELLQRPLSQEQIQRLRTRRRSIPRWLLVLGGACTILLVGYLGVQNPQLRSNLSSILPSAEIDSSKRATIAISIRSSPEAAALVLNGTPRGRTPISDLAIRKGEHRIRLSKQGYLPLDTILVVSARGPSAFTYTLQEAPAARAPVKSPEGHTTALTAETVRAKGSLRVTSIPDGAVVLLNDQRKGITPCTIESLPAGRYRLDLEKGGYASYSGTATVAANAVNHAGGELKAAAKTLTVRVVPSGIIYVDKDRKTEDGNAPYSIRLVPGRYDVTAVSLMWGRWTKSVELDSSEDREIVFDFSREFRVTVTSDPANAKIYVNDVFTGKYTPSLLLLRPGQRKIEVRREGYERRGEPVELTIENDLTEPIYFVLDKTPDQ